MSGILKLGSTTFGTENNGKIDLTNVGESEYSSTNHTWTLKAVDAPIVGANYSTNNNDTSGQLAIYNGATKLWGINESGWIQNPNVPGFRVRNSDYQYVNATGTTKVTWDTDNGNNCYNDGYFNTSSSRYTAPISGKYCFMANVRFDGASSYFRWLIGINGDTDYNSGLHIIDGTGVSTNYQSHNVSGTCNLSAGDYVEFYAFSSVDTSWSVLGFESNFCGFLIG